MDYTTMIMLVLLLAVFYFMLIRPENKRKKQAEEMRNSLKKGDKVTTIGGIVGTIVQVGNDTIVVETSEDRVRLELTKWAISTNGVQTSNEPQASKKKKGEAAAEKEQVDEIPAAEPENTQDAPTEEKKD